MSILTILVRSLVCNGVFSLFFYIRRLFYDFSTNVYKGFMSYSIHFLFKMGIYLVSSQQTQVCYFWDNHFTVNVHKDFMLFSIYFMLRRGIYLYVYTHCMLFSIHFVSLTDPTRRRPSNC